MILAFKKIKIMELEKNIEKKIFKSQISPVFLVISIIVISAFCGAVFGFMAGGLSQKIIPALSSKFPKLFPEKNSLPTQQKVLQEDSAIIDVVEKSAPAVVSIVISKDISTAQNYFFDPFGFFSQGTDPNQGSAPATGNQKQKIGGGSGFLITTDGMIVTNKHVVEDTAASYTVITNDGKEYDAQVLARDPVNDIAVIKISGENFPTLNFGDSDNLKIGQSVIAIGNSLGEFSNTVSRGIVSGLKRNLTASGGALGSEENLTNIIQTDAAINPGNSGGPLLDIFGNVIGINVAMAQGAQNVGFALPANQIKKVVDQVKTTGKITVPYLGVRYIPIDDQIQKENSLPYNYGVLVARGEKVTDFAVMPGSPADKAGITENTVILEFDGIKLDTKNTLTDLIAKKNVGDEITLKIWQKGAEKEIKIKLEERK